MIPNFNKNRQQVTSLRSTPVVGTECVSVSFLGEIISTGSAKFFTSAKSTMWAERQLSFPARSAAGLRYHTLTQPCSGVPARHARINRGEAHGQALARTCTGRNVSELCLCVCTHGWWSVHWVGLSNMTHIPRVNPTFACADRGMQRFKSLLEDSSRSLAAVITGFYI